MGKTVGAIAAAETGGGVIGQGLTGLGGNGGLGARLGVGGVVREPAGIEGAVPVQLGLMVGLAGTELTVIGVSAAALGGSNEGMFGSGALGGSIFSCFTAGLVLVATLALSSPITLARKLMLIRAIAGLPPLVKTYIPSG